MTVLFSTSEKLQQLTVLSAFHNPHSHRPRDHFSDEMCVRHLVGEWLFAHEFGCKEEHGAATKTFW